MQNIKNEAKILLSNHFEIIIGYVLFFISLLAIILPEMLIKFALNILADVLNFRYLKFSKFFIDIPASIIKQLILFILLFLLNYYVFSKVKKIKFKNFFYIKNIFKFISLIIISIVVFIIYNAFNILLLIFKLGYGYFYLLTDIKISGTLSCILNILLISSLIFFNFLYLRHFGCLIYYYFMDMNQSVLDVFKANSNFFKHNKKELTNLYFSFLPNFLLCFFIIPIFYFVPYLQIAMIMACDNYIKEQK